MRTSIHIPPSYTSFEDFEMTSKDVLHHFAHHREELKDLVLRAVKDPELFALSEHYDILDKVVLYASEDKKVRLRLHVFNEGYFDRPHNHRWSYSSYILSGGYRHTIFNLKENVDAPSAEDLFPVLIRQEKAGDSYSLHFSQYHSVIADSATVTLVFRGPSETDRFRIMDRTTNESWWQFGNATESEEEKAKKKMTPEQFERVLEKLATLGVI